MTKAPRRKTIVDIKKSPTPIVMLTAYTATSARLADPHVDVLLVGDSLAMVLYGMDSTLGISLQTMIEHGKAVVRSSKSACVVVDMPFGSYQGSHEAAFAACARVIAETGCQAVKIEGGAEMESTIAFLTARAIPVLAHIGLMPQHVNSMGGYRYQGRTQSEREKILADAIAVERAGAFGVVLEGVEETLAAEITAQLKIATIGIGASPSCDGQVLVAEDMLGITLNPPSFAKQYADLASDMDKAFAAYAKDVRSRKFPAAENCFIKK